MLLNHLPARRNIDTLHIPPLTKRNLIRIPVKLLDSDKRGRMDIHLDNIKHLAAKGEAGRLQLMSSLHSLAYSLETVDDTISRFGAMVRIDCVRMVKRKMLTLIHISEPPSGYRASRDQHRSFQVFGRITKSFDGERHLRENRSRESVDEYESYRHHDSAKYNSMPLDRILRYLATIGAVDEISQGQYAANNITQNLAEKVTEAGLSH
jgi:hypothetical protein